MRRRQRPYGGMRRKRARRDPVGMRKITRLGRPWKSRTRMFPCDALKEGTLVRLFRVTEEFRSTSSGDIGVQAWPIGGRENECLPHKSVGVVVGRMDVHFPDIEFGPDEYVVDVGGKLYALWRYQLRRVKGQ